MRVTAGAMNLGDGLKLETHISGGKTRLILATYDVEGKSSKQTVYKPRAQKAAVRTKPAGQVLKSVQSNNVKTEEPSRKGRPETGRAPPAKPSANLLKELENERPSAGVQQNGKQEAEKSKAAPKKPPALTSKQKPQQKKTISAEELRESLVCLTQEQFQQILQTINKGKKAVSQDPAGDRDPDGEETEQESAEGLLRTDEHSALSGSQDQPPEQTADIVQNVRPQDDLFSRLGERERDKSLQEAKKAQWRRELDEQVALKKQMKESTSERLRFRHRENSTSEKQQLPDQPKDLHANDYGSPSQDETLPKTSTTDSSPSDWRAPSPRASSFSSPDLPAAIRSSFVLGEAAPLDHPFSAVKRNQQKKWLEELNKQREEALQRKMQEKQRFMETEEPDRWAMHFDSFKKQSDHPTRVDHHPEISPNAHLLLSPEVTVPVPLEITPSPALSCQYRGESEMRKSTDEGHGQDHKTGFLRTMTSLLDPVQIEERDRKRLKQIEHQKAIAAQVEEKRKLKQLEEEKRRQEEQEEEQRLEREREKMRKQFEDDSLRQKQKEEVLKMKTTELYQSMLRAQEEAQRLKQEHRMRDLLQRGHNVSKLQRTLPGDVETDLSRANSQMATKPPEDHKSGTTTDMKQSLTIVSPRKDTGVQTDFIDSGIIPNSSTRGKETEWRNTQSSSPDIPVEFKKQPKTEIQMKNHKSLKEKSDSQKENKHTVSNTYDQFARTAKETKENFRKPDWNKKNPNKKYVPASERYPRGLQKQREESKSRRQMELLQLVEKNTANTPQLKKGSFPEKSPTPHEASKVPPPVQEKKGRQLWKKEEQYPKPEPTFKRSDSPPVPAVRNRLQQNQWRPAANLAKHVYNGNAVHGGSNPTPQHEVSPESSEQESERPPSSHFIPYVRTKEIYYLDPDAPMSRPSTQDPQYRRPGDNQDTRQIFSSDHARDPLLNPSVLKNKDRQQAILKGLSELRKGLLQKQKELETGLMPDV
ncbi:coiled-coil domain-containing protein 66 [Spea bombifrons]|uniref:coiled-coil domain-containing protein 66 n=1 Tax=Spea bombifrons TaxID=233779 RepID=UPI00234AB318|nr:coiled-coil domain-containing protein 66 [Spea bombifrons]